MPRIWLRRPRANSSPSGNEATIAKTEMIRVSSRPPQNCSGFSQGKKLESLMPNNRVKATKGESSHKTVHTRRITERRYCSRYIAMLGMARPINMNRVVRMRHCSSLGKRKTIKLRKLSITAPQFAPGFSHWARVWAATSASVEKLARTTA